MKMRYFDNVFYLFLEYNVENAVVFNVGVSIGEFEGEIIRSIPRGVCNYSQVRLESYLDFIPKTITGDWTATTGVEEDPKQLVNFRNEGNLRLGEEIQSALDRGRYDLLWHLKILPISR